MTVKRISSEIKIQSDSELKIKSGTIDRKYPSSLYYIINAYIVPTREMDFEYFFNKFENNIRQILRRSTGSIDTLCNQGFICTIEVASEWIKVGKPSFIDIQLYLTPTTKTLTETDYNFKTISIAVYERHILPIINFINNKLSESGLLIFNKKPSRALKTI